MLRGGMKKRINGQYIWLYWQRVRYFLIANRSYDKSRMYCPEYIYDNSTVGL